MKNLLALLILAFVTLPASAQSIRRGTNGVQVFSKDGTSLKVPEVKEYSGSFTIIPSGSGTGSATVSYTASKIGKTVTLVIAAFNITTGATAGFLLNGTALSQNPEIYPKANISCGVAVKENNIELAAPGKILFYLSGRIDIYKTQTSAATFANGVAGLAQDISCSWITN
jgi:hypothetical protein